MKKSSSPILDLYPDVFLQILHFLPAKDLSTSYQVCHQWNRVISKNETVLWKSLYTSRWQMSDAALEGLKDWKTAYFDSFNRNYSQKVHLIKKHETAKVVEKFAWVFTFLVFSCFMIFEFFDRVTAFLGGAAISFSLTFFFSWLSVKQFASKEGKLSNYLFQWHYFFPMRNFLHSAPPGHDEMTFDQQTQKFWMLMGLQIWLFFHLRVFIEAHWFYFFFISNYLCWLIFDSKHIKVDPLNRQESVEAQTQVWTNYYVKSRVYAAIVGVILFTITAKVPSLLNVWIVMFWIFFGTWIPFAWVIFPRVCIHALISRPQPKNHFHWFIDRFILVPSAISPIFILCLFEATQTDATWEELKSYSKAKSGLVGGIIGLFFGLLYLQCGPTAEFSVLLSRFFIVLCGCFLGLWFAYLRIFFVEYFKAEKDFGNVQLTFKRE